MALVHRATLTPSKQELIGAWLPGRSWAAGLGVSGPADVGKVAEYRFDDPAGQVGVETILWRVGDGAVIQTPLTYRAAPLAGAERHLIGTSDHSVLGQRWVYDGCADPVWAATLAAAIRTGGAQADMYFEQDGERIDVPPRMQVRGSGGAEAVAPEISSIDSVTDEGPVTVVRAGGHTLRLARVLDSEVGAAVVLGEQTLIGRIGDAGEPMVLAGLSSTG